MSTDQDPRRPARSSASTWVVLAVGFAFVLLWVFVIGPRLRVTTATQAGVGQPLIVLELQPLTGTEAGVSLDDIRGKVALINYWGTWCPPCVAEFPHMVELWDQYRGNPDFVFLSVSSTFADNENVPEVREETELFLKRHETTMPTYIDADGVSRSTLAGIMGTPSLAYPTTVLVDRAGIIRGSWVGYRRGTEIEMQRMVSKLVNERP